MNLQLHEDGVPSFYTDHDQYVEGDLIHYQRGFPTEDDPVYGGKILSVGGHSASVILFGLPGQHNVPLSHCKKIPIQLEMECSE